MMAAPESTRDKVSILFMIRGFGGCLRFLTMVWHLDLDFDITLVLDIPMSQILALYLDFEGVKNSHVLYS